MLLASVCISLICRITRVNQRPKSSAEIRSTSTEISAFYHPELHVERQESNPQLCPASELNLILLLLSELRITAQAQVILVSH